MKLRLFTGPALVLALGGCASYSYVGEGGGYYSGGSSTEYVYAPGYGGYGYGYGYGVYGYGSPYYGYRYNPGWSLGVRYGSPYGYYSGYPYYSGGGYYRTPHHYPRPPAHPSRPGGHDGHGGRPDRPNRPPPHAGGNPSLDHAPWRDLDRVRDGNGPRPQWQARPGQARPDMVPRADGETWQGPSSAQRRMGGPRPTYQGDEAGPRNRAPAGPRVGSREGNGDAGPRQMPPQTERRMERRSSPRPSESSSRYTAGGESATGTTAEP